MTYAIKASGSASPTISGNTITGTQLDPGWSITGEGSGIFTRDSASPTITGNTVGSNASHGIYFWNQTVTTPTVTNNTFTNNSGSAIYTGSSFPVISGNSASGNYRNGISINAIPGGSGTWRAGDLPYIITGIVTVNSGVTLTIQPGTIVKFEFGNSKRMSVSGTLVADGTPESKIVFTSVRDDSYAGDTNNDGSATVPQPGDWEKITLTNSSSVIDNVVIKYGGRAVDYLIWDGTLCVSGGSPSVTNSTFSNNMTYAIKASGSASPTISGNTITSTQFDPVWGITAEGTGIFTRDSASPAVHSNNIYGNAYRNVYNAGTSTVNAEYNWWGTATNPASTIYGPVDYDPWALSPYTGSGGGADPQGRYGSDTPCGYFGEPVNTATGNYIYEHEDLNIPGKGIPIQIVRSYNSQDTLYNGPLGYGWTFNYNTSLRFNSDESITWVKPDGQRYTFTKNPDGSYNTPQGIFEVLTKNPDLTYTLKFKDQSKYNFNASGYLTSQVDKHGNTTTLSYTGNLLTTVADPGTRTITFTYTSNRITRIQDQTGRNVQYGYDGSGNLTTFTDMNSKATTFTYDSNHQLLTMREPEPSTNPFLTNHYLADGGANGKVDWQKDTSLATTTFAYDTVNRRTTLTDNRGKQTVHEFDDRYRLTKSTDPLLHSVQSSYGALDVPATVTNQNGKVTTFTYDGNGNTASTEDPLHHAVTASYDLSNNNLLWTKDALGRQTNYNYDLTGKLLESIVSPVGTTSFTYYTDGLLDTLTDDNNHLTDFGYNSYGNLTSIHDALTKPITFEYDTVGRMTASIDANNHKTQFAYDGEGNIRNIKDPLAISDPTNRHQVDFAYDANGNQKTFTDANSNLTQFGYDDMDNLISVVSGATRFEETDPSISYSGTWSVGSDPSHSGGTQKFSKITGNYATFNFTGTSVTWVGAKYNNRGIAKVYIDDIYQQDVDLYSSTWQAQSELYTKNGLTSGSHSIKVEVKGTKNPSSSDYYVVLDAFDVNLSAATRYEQTDASVSWTGSWTNLSDLNYSGGSTKYTNQAGATSTLSFDGRSVTLISAITSNRGIAKVYIDDIYQQDIDLYSPTTYFRQPVYTKRGLTSGSHSLKIEVTGTKNASSSNSYVDVDALDVVPDSSKTATYTYDPNYNLKTVTDPLLHTTTYDYYDDNKLWKITDPLLNVLELNYDPVGNLTKTTNANGNETNYSYYDDNLLNTVTHNNEPTSYSYTYNPTHTINTVTDNNGKVFSYGYDNGNRLTSANDRSNPAITGGFTVQRGYDGVSNLTSLICGGTTYSYGYNARDDLTSLLLPSGTVAFAYDDGRNRTDVNTPDSSNRHYSYNDANRITQVRNTINSGVQTFDYTHDGNGNIKSENSQTYSYDALNILTTWVHQGVTTSYTYDDAGNLTEVADNGTPTRNFTYNAANQITNTGYTYDLNGNMASDGTYTYIYDGENRLKEVKQGANVIAAYTYDYMGRRTSVTESGTTTYFHYDGWNVVAETDSSGNAIATYAYDLNDQPISMTRGGNTYYYQYNAHGDVVSLTNSLGQIVNTYTYDPWGKVLTSNEQVSNPYRYAGYRYDATTGLYYLQKRYYKPDIFRFITPDADRGDAKEPLTLNLYLYVKNNPLNAVDPSGEWAIQIGISVSNIGGGAGGQSGYFYVHNFSTGEDTIFYSENANRKSKGFSIGASLSLDFITELKSNRELLNKSKLSGVGVKFIEYRRTPTKCGGPRVRGIALGFGFPLSVYQTTAEYYYEYGDV
jgi:RHS repeat-associated protein